MTSSSPVRSLIRLMSANLFQPGLVDLSSQIRELSGSTQRSAPNGDPPFFAADNISSILKAANVTIDPYWPSLFAKLCQGKDIGAMLNAVGSAGKLS